MTRIRYVPKIHVIGNKPTNIDHVCTIEIQNIYPLYTCPRMYVRRYVCMRVQIYLSGIQNSILRTIYVRTTQLGLVQFNQCNLFPQNIDRCGYCVNRNLRLPTS